MFWLFIIIPAAYLLGSIPTSVWLGRAIKGIDLRDFGSGNAGASNAFRILGKPLGILVLVLDLLKGFAAVKLVLLQEVFEMGTESWMILRIGLGLVAIVGHIFPVFAGFRGGKGVATLAGVSLALHPLSALAALGVYLPVVLLSRISALGSMLAVISYPVWIIWVFKSEYLSFKIFSLFMVVLILFTHRSNIKRLLKGKELSIHGKTE